MLFPMVTTNTSLRVLRVALLTLCAGNVLAASQTIPTKPAHAATKPDSLQGKQAFARACAGCHGLDGKGGERAPNIADRPSVQRLSDAQVFRIIQNGVPGTGMPAFHSLESSQIKTLVAYLRTLQGTKQSTKLPGNPDRGKAIFSAKAGCSQCHMIAGEGGFIASDLSDYARNHEIFEIRSAITDPTGTGRPVKLITVFLRSGERYSGRVRNEDNFSLQLQGLDGTFYFISKLDIVKQESDLQALMPSDYGSRLSPIELNDLISYLMSVAGSSGPKMKVTDSEW
jgi:cytochrome c oxidase cbb3-type subunit III